VKPIDAVKLHQVAKVAPYVGVACVAALIVALVTQLESWEAAPFVLLFHGALISAIVSAATLIAMKRRGDSMVLPESHATARTLLWIIVTIGALWFWAPGLMVPVVGRVMRAVSSARF
jgi:hypothetical protein